MKRIITFAFLTVALQGFAQDFLYPKNGERRAIKKESILVEWRSNRVSFLSADGTKRETIRYRNLDSIRYDNVTFRTFEVGKKRRGFFVLARFEGHTLATLNKKYTVSRGGFSVDYSKHDVAVFKGDELAQQISFTENNDRKNSDARIKAAQLIQKYFGGCQSVSEKLSKPYDGALREGAVLRVLTPAEYLKCQ